MKVIPFLLFFLLSVVVRFDSFAQKAERRALTEDSWTTEELAMANTAKDVTYLTEEEKKIVFYMNLVRIDGLRFFDTYFQDFIDVHNRQMQKYSNYNDLKISKNDKYYRGLEIDLKYVRNIGLLYPDEALSLVSKQHGRDMSKHNIAGHNSYDGRTMVDRISKVYSERAMAENLAFGFSKGLDNVSMLLLDKGVPDVGHRKNILNSTLGLNIVGVSIQSHPLYHFASITDFVAIPGLKI
jgi:hypothetical protein